MSSLRVALGSSLSTAVRSGSGVGLLNGSTIQRCWLSSYTISKNFHSLQYRQSGVGKLSTTSLGRQKLGERDQKFSGRQQVWKWPVVSIHSSSVSQRSSARIDESLNRLDVEIRKVGRIRRQEVDEILEDIKEMKKATSSQSLMIIRCCGELIPEEPPSSRTELVQQVWKTLESLSVPMDVSHYNALLRVYLENEHKFNPTEFLNNLTSKGIEPNRVTYQRLIARFCQDGDIDGASTILQHMKEKQMPINEYVFNALILGHGQANDMESAEGILGVMKQAGLEPNDDTYVTLMTCYAKHGDIGNVHRIAKECEQREIFLIDRDFLNVIHSLASNNHLHLVDEVLPYLKKHSGFNQEATSLIFRLVNIGQEQVAFKILKQMTPIVRQEGPVPSGNFFIKHLVQLSRPNEIVIKYCKSLQEEGLNNYAFNRAAEFALIGRKFDLAMELFEAMQQNGIPVRQHYFWPFFASASSERDIRFGLRCMKDLGFSPSTETLRDYIIPNVLNKKNESIERTLQNLSSNTGLSLSTISSAAMMHLLTQNELGTAADFATKYRLRFRNPLMRRAIVEAYIRTRDAESFVKIIGSSSIDGDDSAREDVGYMLMELIDTTRSPQVKIALLEPALKQLLANGLGLSNSGSELLQNTLGEALTPELANIIGQLTSGELTPKLTLNQDARRAEGPAYLEEKSSEELEQMLAEATRKNSPTKGIRKALLYSYCRDRNLEKLEALKQGLEKEDFVFTSGLHAMFVDVYSSFGKLDEAKKSYDAILQGMDVRMDDLKILRYASALQSAGDLEQCVQILKTAPRDESRKPMGGAQQVTVWKLLNEISDLGPEKVKEVFNILNERKLTPVNNATLGPLIKAYLSKDDLEGALQEFERCVHEYRATPWKQELFCRFIKLEDAERLQKVMDLSTSIHGEVNSMYDLVFAFIDCGKLRQARKILETPGLRARNDKIEMYCQRYCQENRTAELENLIQVTKDLMDVDRNSMYFYLLQAHCKNGDTDKALSVWTSMQEENVQPSVELLIYLADFLQKNNCSVPFVVPDPSEMMPSTDSSSDASTTTTTPKDANKITLPKSIVEFRRCIDMNEIDKALQLKQRMEADGTPLNIADMTNLIQKLARAERLNEATRLCEQLLDQGLHPFPKTLRFLFARLANAGDVNALERMEDKLPSDLKRFAMYNSRHCLAYANADRGAEYFENFLKKTVESANEGARKDDKASSSSQSVDDTAAEDAEEIGNVPVLGAITLLRRNENLLEEFENLASAAQGLQQRALNNVLYVHFMSKKEYSRANEIWDKSLKSESRVLFRVLAMEARRNNDVELATTLSSHILAADNLRNRAKAVACSCALDVLAETGQIDEAIKHLDNSLKTITLEDYPRSVLQRLKEVALAANKKFPYEIPQPRGQVHDRKRLDSSDSDSD